MAKSSPRGGNRLSTNMMGRPYFYYVEFEINAESAPDGITPTNGHTIARADTGDFTVTFDEATKPANIHMGICQVEGDNAGIHAKFTGYTASTGVATISVYDEDNTSGIEAVSDANDVTIQCLFMCNGSKKVSDR